MKSKLARLNLKNKKEVVKLLLLIQTFLIIAVIVYLGIIKWDMIEEQYRFITMDTVLMVLIILSGLVSIASIYLFHEIVKLIEKEKEHEIQKFEIKQMQEANDLLKSQKHDFSNNLQVLWGLLSLGNMEKAKEYLEKYSHMLKINEEELAKLSNLSCEYLYTLLLNKAYKCKDMEIEIYYNIKPSISLEGFNPIDIVRILGNLLDNAIYEAKNLDTQENSIILDMYCDEENNIFQITNSNICIPKKVRDEIFKKGFTTKGSQGSGFGLYNVKNLVKKYNGQINVKSDHCTGTSFIISLPKRQA